MSAIPVHVLTGFLGSGKTTLLRHLLSSPGFADCAVLVNEFGEIGLDHHLVADLRGDVVLMQSGCLCCTMRGDLAQSMRDLYARRERGEIGFARMVVETTGLADPTPILATIMHEPQLRHHFRLGNVIATVDAVNGAATLDRQPESVKQAAIADRIIVTKADLADTPALVLLEQRLARLNPAARRWRSADAPPPAEQLLGEDDADGRPWPSPNPLPEGEGSLSLPLREGASSLSLPLQEGAGSLSLPLPPGEGRGEGESHAGISAFTMTFGADVDWGAFAIWFTLLLHAHGADVLRVKGLLRVAGAPGPVVVNAVQHLVHPPQHLDTWPQDWRRSQLVFIVRDLAGAAIQRSFTEFHRLLSAAAGAPTRAPSYIGSRGP